MKNTLLHALFFSNATIGYIGLKNSFYIQNVFCMSLNICDIQNNKKNMLDGIFSEIPLSQKFEEMAEIIKPGGFLISPCNIKISDSFSLELCYKDLYIRRKKISLHDMQVFCLSIKSAIFLGNLLLQSIEDSLTETQLLLGHTLQVNTAHLYMFPEQKLTVDQELVFAEYLQQRIKRVPFAYIVGKKGFMSRDFIVTPDTLIPRPETEFIVEYVLKKYKDSFVGLDLATGSGCIAISILCYSPSALFIGSDISYEALKVARQNAILNNVSERIQFVNGNLFAPFAKGSQFDCIVSNPPYISAQDYPHLQGELKYEPACALTDYKDGYYFYKKILQQAYHYLKKGGELILEIGYGQAEDITNFIPEKLRLEKIIKDYNGIERVLVIVC